MTITDRLRSLVRNTRGVSNVIVMVLSLIILVIIGSNIIMWSYQMSQLDWEKTQESFIIGNVTSITDLSPWFTVGNEYLIAPGTRTAGNFTDTWAVDSQYEEFTEVGPGHEMNLSGIFAIDTSTCPLGSIETVEIQMRCRTDDANETWFLKGLNWTNLAFDDSGFNSTAGHTPTTEWSYYRVNLTSQWPDYMHSNGTVKLKLVDGGPDSNQTAFDVDFFGVRVALDGARFVFQNTGSLTSHQVSLWISNSTHHQRYELNQYINSAETLSYTMYGLVLPDSPYMVKVVSERGNIAVFHEP